MFRAPGFRQKKRVIIKKMATFQKTVYILVINGLRSYQWAKNSLVPERIACNEFNLFLYGDGVKRGRLDVVRDTSTLYITVTDPLYSNKGVMDTGDPFELGMFGKARAALSEYGDFAHEASGTVGEIYSMTRHGTKFVAKIQMLTTPQDQARFEHEVEMHTIFAREDLGLPLIDCQIVDSLGVCVMPFVQTLNEYLHTKRTRSELERVVEELVVLLRRIESCGLTHGDLAFFNIFVDGAHLSTMDFDRASSRVFMPEVDVLRAATELTASTRSEGGKKMHTSNNKYLSTEGFERFKAHFGLVGSASEIDQNWEKSYTVYCQKAQVRCL